MTKSVRLSLKLDDVYN